ncbi:enoyl-CoA hydratase/isomerase family protein [Ottowia thiooxydans]|uniref:enoyl-CoA hydratase/isomerase family protein n=1 Tax=Ottowia thiooxydans TaxID=219182 RepID=UPI0003FD0EA7|nr:enoyl-CoA hydratase/isomerase family protein [Ottowia thiooxydans]
MSAVQIEEQAPLLLVEKHSLGEGAGSLAIVTFNRGDKMNPMDWAMAREMRRVFDQLAVDEDVRVVGITGSGRAFSAGGDMKKYQKLQRESTDFPHFLADIHETFQRIATYPKPYVALVNGIAVAGGIELILSCDLVICAQSGRIGDAHLNFGQMGGGGVLTMLPRIIGPMRARELIFSGRLLEPAEAMEFGLVNRIVPDGGLLDAVLEFARDVAKKSPLAVANAKQVLNAGLNEGTGVQAAFRLEREATARYCLTSSDAHEGLEAFATKRPPKFTGR